MIVQVLVNLATEIPHQDVLLAKPIKFSSKKSSSVKVYAQKVGFCHLKIVKFAKNALITVKPVKILTIIVHHAILDRL